MTQTALGDHGDKLCFDTIAGHWGSDNQIHENTGNRVCAWIEGRPHGKSCRNGVKHNDCLEFAPNYLAGENIIVEIYGTDALWVDYFRKYDAARDSFQYWGSNNNDGWCMSIDRNDYLDWNHDSRSQHVSADQCYYKIKLDHNGKIYGWFTEEQRMCRQTKKMRCKEGCERGWRHVWSENTGCCSSFTSCFGSRKICARDFPCRRRTEETDADEIVEFLPAKEEQGRWVQLSGPLDETSSLADRLSQTEEQSEMKELQAPADGLADAE